MSLFALYTILYMTLLGWMHASVTMVQNPITVPNLYPMHTKAT
jgi:hypothetical protein